MRKFIFLYLCFISQSYAFFEFEPFIGIKVSSQSLNQNQKVTSLPKVSGEIGSRVGINISRSISAGAILSRSTGKASVFEEKNKAHTILDSGSNYNSKIIQNLSGIYLKIRLIGKISLYYENYKSSEQKLENNQQNSNTIFKQDDSFSKGKGQAYGLSYSFDKSFNLSLFHRTIEYSSGKIGNTTYSSFNNDPFSKLKQSSFSLQLSKTF